MFEYKLFNPNSKFNYYYETIPMSMAYTKVLSGLEPTSGVKESMNRLSRNEALSAEQKESVVRHMIDTLTSCSDPLQLLPNLDILRYLVLQPEYFLSLTSSFPELNNTVCSLLTSSTHPNVSLLLTRLLVNLQKQDTSLTQLREVPSLLSAYLLSEVSSPSPKSRKQAEVMLVYNLTVNGYPPLGSEYLLSLLQNITTAPGLFSDDTLRLGTLMLLCL